MCLPAGCRARWSLLLPATQDTPSSTPCPIPLPPASTQASSPSNMVSLRAWTSQKPALVSSFPPLLDIPGTNFWIVNKLYFHSYWLGLCLGICLGVKALEEEAALQPFPHRPPGARLLSLGRAEAPSNPPGTTFTPPGASGRRKQSLMSLYRPVRCPPPSSQS